MTTPELMDEQTRAELAAFLAEWGDSASTVVVHTSGSTGTPKEMRVEKERMKESARLRLPRIKAGRHRLVVHAVEVHCREDGGGAKPGCPPAPAACHPFGASFAGAGRGTDVCRHDSDAGL